MNYFVTSATGFVGKEVARQLRAAGHTVIAIARNPDKTQTRTWMDAALAGSGFARCA